jgi:hypothetical protein
MDPLHEFQFWDTSLPAALAEEGSGLRRRSDLKAYISA